MKPHPDQLGLAIDGALDASKRAIAEAEARGQKVTELQKTQVDAAAIAATLHTGSNFAGRLAAVDTLGRPIHGAPVKAPPGTKVGAFRKIRGRR